MQASILFEHETKLPCLYLNGGIFQQYGYTFFQKTFLIFTLPLVNISIYNAYASKYCNINQYWAEQTV